MSETTPRPPSHLKRSKALWRALVAEHAFEVQELELLRRACEASDRADEARALLAADGLVVRDRYGQVKPHPAAVIERDSRTALARMLRELALQPSEAGYV
jgi:P27 family predicted phage terminase small subunit